MLFEHGPIAPFPDAEIPRAGAPADLAGLAALEARELEAAAATLQGELLTLAGAADNALERAGAADLAAIAGELANQASGVDPAIADVAGAAAGGEGELAGLASDVGADLYTPIPEWPTIPPDVSGRSPVPPEAPRTEWDAIVMQQVRLLTGTPPTTEQLVYARRFAPDVAALQAWIRAGMPREEAPEAPEAPAPGERWSLQLANDPFGGIVGEWARPFFNDPVVNGWDVINRLVADFRAAWGDAAPEDDLGVMEYLATGRTP